MQGQGQNSTADGFYCLAPSEQGEGVFPQDKRLLRQLVLGAFREGTERAVPLQEPQNAVARGPLADTPDVES